MCQLNNFPGPISLLNIFDVPNRSLITVAFEIPPIFTTQTGILILF